MELSGSNETGRLLNSEVTAYDKKQELGEETNH